MGSHVIQLLSRRGQNVTALVRDDNGRRLVESLGASAVRGCVEDRRVWSHAAGADVIVHAAAIITNRSPWRFYQEINVDGARHAALASAECGARLVHISSVAVYGRRRELHAPYVDERTPWAELRSTDFYARSKRGAEEAVSAIAREKSLSVVSLRPCLMYGERDRTFLPRVLPLLRFGVAPLIGHGGNALALVYAGNVADAVLAALQHPEARGPFNVTDDGRITQREFFEAVGNAIGRHTRFVRLPLPLASSLAFAWFGLRRILMPAKYAGVGASAARYLAAGNPYRSARARSELEWRPSTAPREALERSVRWFVNETTRRDR